MDFEEFLPVQKSFELMAAYLNGSTVNMTVDGEPRRYTGAYVTETFLRVLGVDADHGPRLHRRRQPAGRREGGDHRLRHLAARLRRRGATSSARRSGSTASRRRSSASCRRVSRFPTNEELWIPLYSEYPVRPRNDPQANNPAVIGLLKPGVPFDQAQAEFDGFARRFAAAYPDTNKAFNEAQVEPLIDQFTGPQLRGTMWTMLAFCVGVLLIACVNVMNMQFARATLRARELAVRSSLGATRGRLIRQMLTESALLAAGRRRHRHRPRLLVARLADRHAAELDNPPPSWMTFDLDLPALAVTVGATVVAALVSGLLPAWMASRARVVDVLREGGRGNTSRGVGLITRGLVVAQIVVTCVLLIGSLLQLRSILKQQNIDYGYDTGGLMSARMGLMEGDYPTPESRKLFYDRLLRELQAIRAVRGRRADQPVPDGVRRQRARSRSKARSTRPGATARTPTSSR